LPEKYNTLLGEGGLNVSGGQRQRICIARELFKNSCILIFDEATSALDTYTEKEIQKNIYELKGKKTIVIIAHRLSTVKDCDTIFVLKEGRMVEAGSYEELLAKKNGEFHKMMNSQF
jgi:subfamily B ATP-binding cassette protein MsbA